MSDLVKGKCRVCGCTDLNPCLSQGGDGAPIQRCTWFDAERTLCSNFYCIAVIPISQLMDMAKVRRIM